jgi:hypothetical protein
MSNTELLLKEIEKLPAGCMGEVFDFVGYLQQKHGTLQDIASVSDKGLNLHPSPEVIRRVKEKSGRRLSLHVCTSLEEALADGNRRAAAAEADPSLRSLKKWHGIWENSKAWGKDIDAVTEIRKMRDEWGDLWESSPLKDASN